MRISLITPAWLLLALGAAACDTGDEAFQRRRRHHRHLCARGELTSGWLRPG